MDSGASPVPPVAAVIGIFNIYPCQGSAGWLYLAHSPRELHSRSTCGDLFPCDNGVSMASILNFSNMRLRYKLLITYLGISLGLIVIAGFFTLQLVQNALERNMASELANSTHSILNMVKTTATASIKNYLRAVAEKNLDIANGFYKAYEAGKLTRDEMVAAIRSVLLSQTIGKTGYIYCINSQGVATVHPNPRVQGHSLAGYAFAQKQIRDKKGYLEYEWQNPGEAGKRPKALYMTYFKPLDWIISVSSYRQEFTQLINVDDFRSGVQAFHFGKSGYAYIADIDGNIIIHPRLEGTNVYNSLPTVVDFFREMAAKKRGHIRYWWKNPGEPVAREKLVFYDYLPEFRWIVASTAYYDEALKPFAELRNLIFISAGCVACMLLISTLFISQRLLEPIKGLIDKFKASAEGDLSVRMEAGNTYEFNELSRFFNRFMTRHQIAREALSQSEEKYRLLADNIHDVIWLISLDLSQVLYVSPSMESVQGWTVKDLSHLKLEDMLPPHCLNEARKFFSAVVERAEVSRPARQSGKIELELYRKDGSLLWAEITTSLVFDRDGKPNSILAVVRDINDRKEAEKRNLELQEKLNRMKKMEAFGLLASGVAHDLNNVLSGIVSYPDLLLLDLPEGSSLRTPIETIKTSGLKAATIVQDLLTLARRNVITFEALDLNSLVRDFFKTPEFDKLKSFHPDIDFKMDLEEGLSNLKGASIHLKKTLMNLVSNAAEAQPGGGRVVVKTRNRYLDYVLKGYSDVKAGDYVVLTVEDEGQGIAQQDLPRIFEPFYTKKVMGRSGTGLGMAVVWATVQDHQGYIDVVSQENLGTQFDLYFPLTHQSLMVQKPEAELASYVGRGESILIVDDLKTQREIASKILSKLKYTVYAVSSGKKAIGFLESNSVDLVILDMVMNPGMDGLETFQAIRKRLPDQRVVIASGFAETDRVKTAQALGAGEYIKKPYTIEKIGLAVRRTLDGI
jgi:two-component system, cell cycle sensor histidine kinase and response regulator CckA